MPVSRGVRYIPRSRPDPPAALWADADLAATIESDLAESGLFVHRRKVGVLMQALTPARPKAPKNEPYSA
jgi:hypothetical protein